MTIGVPIVTCLPRLYQQCTNNVPIVKKQSPPNTQSRAMPLPCETSITRAWAVATARRPWARLYVSVHLLLRSMCFD